ncbi:hypothetical protein NGRA_1209 [Nosema granulosis]|uniref:Uncharacterized protein n=1 Tax=Nosema granulosis TaxID=83296 RepID=A0A9P6GYY7_9MICR|nr:hypothetical protein NGRA_1209 [Nosema granulosis]
MNRISETVENDILGKCTYEIYFWNIPRGQKDPLFFYKFQYTNNHLNGLVDFDRIMVDCRRPYRFSDRILSYHCVMTGHKLVRDYKHYNIMYTGKYRNYDGDDCKLTFSDIYFVQRKDSNQIILKLNDEKNWKQKSWNYLRGHYILLSLMSESFVTLADKKFDISSYEVPFVYFKYNEELKNVFERVFLFFNGEKGNFFECIEMLKELYEDEQNGTELNETEESKEEEAYFNVYKMVIDLINVTKTLIDKSWEIQSSSYKNDENNVITIDKAITITFDIDLTDVKVRFYNSIKDEIDLSQRFITIGKSVVIKYEDIENPNLCYIKIEIGISETDLIYVFESTFESLETKRERLSVVDS